jgi:hypothetical protein
VENRSALHLCVIFQAGSFPLGHLQIALLEFLQFLKLLFLCSLGHQPDDPKDADVSNKTSEQAPESDGEKAHLPCPL